LLSTLPTRYVHDGLAEAVKYGCIGDRELFELFEAIETKEDLEKNIEEIILRSVLQKTKFVEEDQYDNGSRQMLNFGHTIGHAIERYFHYSTYTHGEGVAIGMSLLS
ncbi:MAG TPA: 3-dehydroquinate synthase, partial [Dialister sp.]|nr:3-dehydroquinate synthase [Dialister sp.]